MNKTSKDLILFIKMLLTNKYEKLDNPNYNEIYKLAKFHSIQNMLYYAIMAYIDKFSLTSQVEPELLKKLASDNKNAIAKAAYQEEEKEVIFKELEANNIKYMPMKGSIIKYLYPSIDMRSMADLDIYFDDLRSAEVRKILINLGYDVTLYKKSNHDTYQKIPFMEVEMHRGLLSESYAISRYYKDFWPRLIKASEESFQYNFNINDYYVFMTAHAARHFSSGGIGIRNVVDEYIYLNKYQDELDFDYINKELSHIGLAKFESNLKKLSKYWFTDVALEPADVSLMEEMADYIIKSGTYGTLEHGTLNKLMGEGVSENINASKVKYLWHRLFPSISNMKRRNPILNKVIILLPWFYFTRLLRGIFKKREDTKAEVKATTKVNKKHIEKNKKMHDDIGA